MSKIRYTPGPWSSEICRQSNSGRNDHAQTAGYKNIATIVDAPGVPFDEAEGNRLLRDASPEMYAALKDLVQSVQLALKYIVSTETFLFIKEYNRAKEVLARIETTPKRYFVSFGEETKLWAVRDCKLGGYQVFSSVAASGKEKCEAVAKALNDLEEGEE